MTMPAIALSPNEEPLITRNIAIQWVEKNVKKIKGRAVKFLRYSPYDMEDFIQQAYVAALSAADVAQRRGIAFEACFWILFSAESRKMASDPVTRNCFEEFRDDYMEEALSPTFPHEFRELPWDGDGIGEEDQELTDELTEMALSMMTARQGVVWRYLLSKRHYSSLEIAKLMNVTRQVVEELRDTGLRRVKKHFEDKS